jgi:propanol-preferring alcohol dehydrogenase
MSLQFAKIVGAQTIAVDVSENSLKLARRLGADYTFSSDEIEDYISKKGKVDIVMVHAPSPKAISQATQIVKRGGTILMAVLGNIRIIFPEEYSVISSVIGSRQDMKETLKIASMGKVKVEYKTYNLNKANDVLLQLKNGKLVGRAVLAS